MGSKQINLCIFCEETFKSIMKFRAHKCIEKARLENDPDVCPYCYDFNFHDKQVTIEINRHLFKCQKEWLHKKLEELRK